MWQKLWIIISIDITTWGGKWKNSRFYSATLFCFILAWKERYRLGRYAIGGCADVLSALFMAYFFPAAKAALTTLYFYHSPPTQRYTRALLAGKNCRREIITGISLMANFSPYIACRHVLLYSKSVILSINARRCNNGLFVGIAVCLLKQVWVYQQQGKSCS